MHIIRTAIALSLAYAFAVTSCTKADLIIWDTMIGNVIKHFKIWKSTPTAMIREDNLNFGLGAPSICVKYCRRLATVLSSSLEDPLIRHRTITLNLLTKQEAHIHSLTRGPLHNGRNKSTNRATIELLYALAATHEYPLKQIPPHETQKEHVSRS